MSKTELTAESYLKMREANRKYICKFFDEILTKETLHKEVNSA